MATDGHRLARVEVPLPKGAGEIPRRDRARKTVGEVRKLLDESDGSVDVELSDTRIRFSSGNVTLVSKLIDGTFPDYERVIPTGNDKVLNVPCKEFAHAVDRVSTISTEKSRAIKLAVAKGVVTLSATSPDAGSATEEIEVEYKDTALEIGFNSRYLLDITEQIAGAEARFLMADAGSPTLVRDGPTRARSTCSCRCGYDGTGHQRPRLLFRRRIGRCAGTPRRAPASPHAFPQLPAASPGLRRRAGRPGRPNGAGKTNLLEALSFLAPAVACGAPVSTMSAAARAPANRRLPAGRWPRPWTRPTDGSPSAPASKPAAATAACRAGSSASTAGRCRARRPSASMSPRSG